MEITVAILMVCVGIFAATYGSLVGSAGGFILMPLLIVISPESSPAILSAISLSGILVAGISGAWAYHLIGLIDYRSAFAFAIAGIPGAIIGVLIVQQIGTSVFRIILGMMLVLVGLLVLRGSDQRPLATQYRGLTQRHIKDRSGKVYEYQFNLPLGLSANFAVGILKSIFGIGGGLIFTPFAITVLGFPTMVATATSVFTLVFTTLAALIAHVMSGTFQESGLELMPVALGMAVGGQIGPRIAKKLGGTYVKRILAGTLTIIGFLLITSQLL